jgi:hypothetical protein
MIRSTSMLHSLFAIFALFLTTPVFAQAPALGDKPAVPKSGPTVKGSTDKIPVGDLAFEAKRYEDQGAYELAAEAQQRLLARVGKDVDLEIAIALNLARSGKDEEAWKRLSQPHVLAAAHDSMPQRRRHDYQGDRDALWVTGKFDGWHWYIPRARAELAAARGLWHDALAEAQQAVDARPMAGKEWLILAVCAEHDGDQARARAAARTALMLDPTLPEAHYWNGLYAWRDGRRNEAHQEFRTAVDLDSSYAAAAAGLVRCKLPYSKPDPAPSSLFTGLRTAMLLTSPERPKLEEFVQMDMPATIRRQVMAQIPDSLRRGVHGVDITLPILLSARGRIVGHELPWFPPERLPSPVVARMLETLPMWEFNPAVKHQQPQAVWTAILLKLEDAP